MAKKPDFDVAELGDYTPVPLVEEGAMAHSQPYVAKPVHNEALGYPGELVDDWQQVGVAKLGELVKGSRALRVYLDSCVKCGACTDKCHYFLGTGDPKNMPVARQDLLRSVYRRHYTMAGKYFPKLVGAREFDEEMLDDWYKYYHRGAHATPRSRYFLFVPHAPRVSKKCHPTLASMGTCQE